MSNDLFPEAEAVAQRCKKGVLKNFPKFTGKRLSHSHFLNKVIGLRPATLLKKRLWHRCLPVNFAKFLRTPITPLVAALRAASFMKLYCITLG